MSKKKKKAPVVVQAGAPEWMVTFGDLMSLLLTFFVLLFSVSEIKEQKIYDLVRAIRINWDIDPVPGEPFVMEFNDVSELLSTMSLDLPDRKEGKDGEAHGEIENPFGETATVIKVKDNLHINIEGRVLFKDGSWELSPAGKDVLGKVKERLVGYFNRIRIVGHDSPSPSGGVAHDDMGYQRAKAVKNFLVLEDDELYGLDERRLEVATRGASEPMTWAEFFDPTRRARMNRVDIILTAEPVIFDEIED
ncbi:MAG: flagellar motor protein MotB [Planctomycetota bacterium]